MSSCCTLEQIEEFVAGRLQDAAVAEHVSSCARCGANAERVRRNNAFAAELARTVVPAGGRSGGESFDEFEILSEIHRGGQGIVYKAVQRTTHRTVALKVLSEGAFASPAQRMRFEREIDLVAHLNHPNIVTLYDSGVTSDGRQYFAMEYVHGVPLDRYLARDAGPVQARDGAGVRERLDLFATICAAVGHAHQRGVIHRDLKPGNILVDAAGEPHVVDFGLAKAPGGAGAGADAAAMTMTGEFMGTLAYAAPEQLKGDPALIDTRTDVFALGVILYEMVTGHRPFPEQGSMLEVLKAINESNPAPPSRSVRTETPAAGHARMAEPINDEVDTIVLKALARDKDRRYPSADALRADVVRYLRGEPIEAKSDSSWYVLRKTLRRHKGPVGVVAGMVALLALFGTVMSVMYGVQVQERQRADRNAARAGHVSGVMQELFAFASPFEDTAGVAGERTLREFLDYASQQIKSRFQLEPQTRAALLTTMGRAYTDLGMPQTAMPLLLESLQLCERHLGPGAVQTGDTLLWLGDAHESLGERPEAAACYERAQSIASQALGRQSEEYARARHYLAGVRAQDDPAAARAMYGEVLALRRALLGPRHPDVAETLNDYAYACEDDPECDPAVAEAYHREALTLRESVLPAGHASIVESLNNLGAVMLERDPSQARELFDRALAMESDLLARHPYTAGLWNNLAHALEKLGEMDQAEAAYRRAIDVFAALGRRDDPRLAAIEHELGVFLWQMGDTDAAEAAFRDALRIARKSPGDASSPGRELTFLAALKQSGGLSDDAVKLADQAIATFRAEADPSPVDLANALSLRGKLALDAGREAEAEPYLRECWELRRDALGADHPDTQAATETLARCRQDQQGGGGSSR